MKTLHTIYTNFAKRLVVSLIALITIGVGVAWGEEVVAYTFTTVQNSTNSSYASTYDVTIDGLDWNVPGNQNFDGYMSIGGNQIENVDRVITGKSVISDAITKIVLNHKGLTVGTFKVNSIIVTVASDDNFSTIIDEVTISTPTLLKNEEGSITFTPTPNISEWKANSYYKITFNVTYTAKSNHGLKLASIVFYKENTPSTFTVTCQSNNSSYGTVSQASVTNVANNTAISANGNTLTVGTTPVTATPKQQDVNYNYAFSGWSGIPSGNKVTANCTITANFTRTERALTNYRTTCTEPSTFTVTYNANDATSGSVPEDNTEYAKDAQVTVLGNTGNLAKTGYTFSGWNTEANGTGTTYAAGDKFTITENTTLYAKWTAKIDPAIAWNPTTCTVTIDAGEELPIFQNPNNLTPITFESSNSEVASVDNNGVITLGTTATTAIVTITATFDGDATYAAKEATCTLTVNPSNCRWVEVTDNTTLEDGDWVVIAMANAGNIYALPNNQGTSTPDGTLIDNLAGNKINTVVDKLKWTVEKTEGNYIFHPNGNNAQWLYCINSDNGVRVGTGDAKTFILDPTTGYLVNTQTNNLRYLRLGQSGMNYVWRCYTTNTAGQTLKFYKRECLDASKVWVEGNLTNVTCSPQLPQQLAKDGSITLTFTAADGYALPNDVTVSNATKTWNKADGTLTISNPTDNVMVTVEAVELHTITWMVGSNSVLTEEVANATGVTQTPDDPANGAIGECANAFMGWTETSLGSAEGQSAPADLCTAAQMKAKHTSVTGDKTFYAVFATADGEDIDYSNVHTSNATISAGSRCTASKVIIDEQEYDAMKAGTNNYSGSIEITVPAGTTNLYFKMAGWTGKGSNTITLSGATADPTTFKTIADAGISGAETKYALAGNIADYSYSVALEGITTQTTLVFSNSAKEQQFVIWGANAASITYSNYVTQCCTDWTPTLTYSKTTLDSESSETATPTITGNTHNAPVSFESSNTSVLTVDANNGTITAVGAGKATITATWDATGEYCEKSITTDEIIVNGNFLVTFHANDGSGNTTTQQIPSNTTTALNANTFQRDGYTFQGWATSASGAKVYDDGQEVTLSTSGLDLYAVWQVKAYKITIGTITGNGTITTSPANSANYDAQVTITATPAAHYTFASVTVTRDDNSQTVVVGDNKFTMPASDVTITAVFTENEKFAINYAIPTGGGTLTDNAPTFIYIDGSITLPGIKDGTISSEYSCEEFIGWTTNPANHEAAGLKPEPFYNTGASFSDVSEDVTFYPVYSRPGAGVGGTVTLTAEEMEGWATAQSYGTLRELVTCHGTWKTTGVKSTGNPIQLNATNNPYVEFPELQGNITQVVLNATNGSNATLTSGTFTLKTLDGQTTIASASVNNSGVCTLTVTGSYKTARLYSSSGTARITNIAITYGPPAIISTTLDCSSDVDDCTIIYDLNESFLAAGTQVLGSCHNSTFKFSEVGTYTICSEPQANEYKLIGWNNQCDGKGSLTYTPGQEITSLPQNIITLYAQWAPEVIVHDSYEETKVYPTAMGGSITLNSGQYACDPKKYDFIGWTTDDPQLWQQNITPPTLLADNGDGSTTFTPEEPSQVYAVYAIEDLANSDAFKLSSIVQGTKYYAKYDAYRDGHMRATTEVAEALTFGKEQSTGSTYKIFFVNPNGEKEYIYSNGDLQTSSAPLETWAWTISGTAGNYTFTSANGDGKCLSTNGNSFSVVLSENLSVVFDMEVSAEYKYIAKTNCSENVTITFVPGNGSMTPSTNPVTAKTGDIITLPTCEYEGWIFEGWVTENIELTEFRVDPSRLYTGTYEVGNSDVTLYAYYTQTPNPADFDGTTSGIWKMYTEVSTDVYKYALSHGSSSPNTLSSTEYCPNATEWTFTNAGEANVYYIQDEDNLYLTPELDDTQLYFTSTPFPWKIVKIDDSDEYRIYKYDTRSDDYNRLIMSNSNGLFYHSAKDNERNIGWHHVTIGGCTNPVYTTDPQPSKIISLVGSPMITSTIGQTVKASQKLQLVIKDMDANAEVTIAADGLTFYDTDNNVVNSLQTGPNGSLTATFTVAYTPTVADNQIVKPTITVTCGSTVRTFYNVSCRNLPANFVIATKVGATWYALPANMNGATNPEGVVIDVDETNMTAIAPNTTVYTLFPVATVNGNSDRYKEYGERLRFAAVNNGNRGLWANDANSGTTINNDAAITAANSTAGAAYEWKITTTIVNGNWQYTLQTDQSNNTRHLRYWTAASGGAKWGTYAYGNEQLYFLPVTTYTDLDLEVMEWGTNSMVIRAGEDLPQNVNITINGTTTSKTLQNINGSDLYKIDDVTLTSDDCGTIIIDNGSNARKIIRKPLLVSGNKSGSEYTTSPGRDICAECDIVILNGGKLIADEAKTVGYHVDFANIYVYPGGKLVLDGKSLGVKRQVYLRGGYSWINQTSYALPEVYVNGAINFNGSGNIIYDYYIQNYKYYQFSLPYQVPLTKVTDEAGVNDFPVWVKHYNGALRATNANATSWEWYYGDNFEAGIGYIIAAKPRQEGKVAYRPLSIIRFPLGNSVISSAEADKSIATTAHGIDAYNAGTITANNVGWNFIGNPFMATWKGDIGHQQLMKSPDAEHWNGSYHWEDNDVRYITVMSPEDGTDYAQYTAATTELKPFFPFYLQETADGGDGTINFAAANRIQKAPAELYADEPREAFVQIEILTDVIEDQTGIFVSDTYSDDIDFDDYEKMFGSSADKSKLWLVHDNKRMAFEAMTEASAAANIALGYRAPKTGSYTFAINEDVSALNEVMGVYLTDHELGVTDYNLLYNTYEFETEAANYNDKRFTIRIVLSDDSNGVVTGVDNIGTMKNGIYKFFYQDKMYIYNEGIIYDATGKQVTNINK